jgi:hypothetical protein
VDADLTARQPDVRRWTGLSAFAVAVLLIAESTTQLSLGSRPALTESEALAAFTRDAATGQLVVVMLDTVLMSMLVVFLGCFRQLVTRARPDLEWIADIGFAAGVVWVGVTLVGDAMAGGAALDAVGGSPDPVVIRALTEGHMLMFGAVGCTLTALVAASAGYLTFASHVLPNWTGWFAYAAALLNIGAIPTVFIGGTDETSIFAVGGWANAVLATFPWLLWVILVGVVTVRGERARHPHAGRSTTSAAL